MAAYYFNKKVILVSSLVASCMNKWVRFFFFLINKGNIIMLFHINVCVVFAFIFLFLFTKNCIYRISQ